MQVFICYSRADKKFAYQLVEDLSRYEMNVWMDVRSIPHGANWDLEVQKGLDASDLMLVLLTPPASASQNVADEWSYFIEKEKPIVPLLIQPCDVPFRLSRRQRVDFTGDYGAGLQQLLRAIGSPALRDPDSTQPLLPVRPISPPKPASNPKPAPVSAPASTSPTRQTGTPTAPEVGIKIMPVIWAEAYHWFRGMGNDAAQGDIMISKRELKFVPHARPITAIPLNSLVSAKLQRSVDHYLKLTYYGPDNKFRSLVLMGAPKDRRKQITLEVLNLLKLLTGRALD